VKSVLIACLLLANSDNRIKNKTTILRTYNVSWFKNVQFKNRFVVLTNVTTSLCYDA